MALTDDLVLPVGQVVAHHAAYVRAQAVPHAVDTVRGRARPRQERVQLSGALAHQPGVAQRRQVTRVHGQRAPVGHEHVEFAAHQVR